MTNTALAKKIADKKAEIESAKFTLSLIEEEQQGKAASPNEIERWDAQNLLDDMRKMKEKIRKLEQELAALENQPEDAENAEPEKNAYFENLYRVSTAYEDAKAERMKERDALKEKDDWDGVRAFDKREERDFPRPYTRGQSDAFRAYRENLYNRNDGFFEVRNLPWEKDAAEFVKALRDAGIKRILVTDASTALLDDLFTLQGLGCRMTGLRTYTRMEKHFGREEETEVRGIEVEMG